MKCLAFAENEAHMCFWLSGHCGHRIVICGGENLSNCDHGVNRMDIHVFGGEMGFQKSAMCLEALWDMGGA